MTLEHAHHEEILHAGIAYCYKGPMLMIGTLSLTSNRLLFTTHRLNFSQFSIVIPLEDIASIKPKNHLRIFNHGVVVTLHNGGTDTFAVWKRRRWVRRIDEARSALNSAKNE